MLHPDRARVSEMTEPDDGQQTSDSGQRTTARVSEMTEPEDVTDSLTTDNGQQTADSGWFEVPRLGGASVTGGEGKQTGPDNRGRCRQEPKYGTPVGALVGRAKAGRTTMGGADNK